MTRPLPAPGARRLPALATTAIAIAAAALLAGCLADGRALPAPEIRTLSNRADLVSGGNVLAEIVFPPDTRLEGLQIRLNDVDVAGAFTRQADGRWVGLVTGLRNGTNYLSARTVNTEWADLMVTNAPRQGPVVSGPHVRPYVCATPVAQPAAGSLPATNFSGLSGQPDADCNIAAEVRLWYRTTTAGCSLGIPDPTPAVPFTSTAPPTSATPPANPCFKPYTPGTTPADLATTTTDGGRQVPYIVRVERGTMNRGIYDIAVLVDPARAGSSALNPDPTWNGKLLVNFGAATGQPRRQSRPAGAWSGSDAQLGRGWMVVSSNMLDSARNSNRVLMSETLMMLKEHIAETYGAIRYTVGSGCSGGAINSNQAASVFPGLVDGITTSCTYPDAETTALEVNDCVLLVEAYQKPGWLALMQGLTQEQINARKAAINGHPDQSACHAWYNAFGNNARAGVFQPRVVANNTTGALLTQPTVTNNCELPNSAVYDPANPVATANLPRCDGWSWGLSVWGATTAGGNVGRRTADNVGVQYGLKALRDGVIGAEEFVTLNELVGGTDNDSSFRAARSVADPAALETAYRSGIVSSGRNLAKVAIIDMRGWDDSNVAPNVPPGLTPPAAPIHHVWYSFAVRDRLVAEGGGAGNQALWRFARTGLLPSPALATEAFLSMDQWLAAVKADTSASPIETKIRNARPAGTTDFCFLSSDATQSVRVTNAATCDADPFLRPSLSPRQVAGGPRAENVLKCQLKPLVQSDYPAGTFTPGQWARMQALFSTGVCDFSRPGVGQQAVAASALTFAGGPGGQPLPPAPVSARRN